MDTWRLLWRRWQKTSWPKWDSENEVVTVCVKSNIISLLTPLSTPNTSPQILTPM